LFLLALLLLSVGIVWALTRFSLPRQEYVDIGPLSGYPPSDQPYEIHEPLHLYVVNYRDQLVVLDPLNRVPGGYRVKWHAQEGIFIDPNRGTIFDLFGMPTRRSRINAPVDVHSLPRYQLQIRDGQIWVEVSRPLIETVSPVALP